MDWFALEILTGLQKLSCLSLDRTPAAEVIPGTAQAWIEALASGRSWEQARDASRIRGAFVTLAQTCDRWPAPKQFLAALPDSTQLRIAGPGERPADPPELLAAMEATKRGIELPKVAPVEGFVEPRMSRAEMDRIERELVDRKRAAAGDTNED